VLGTSRQCDRAALSPWFCGAYNVSWMTGSWRSVGSTVEEPLFFSYFESILLGHEWKLESTLSIFAKLSQRAVGPL
jgi:hypothetical protein